MYNSLRANFFRVLAAFEKTRCSLKLVADYHFYKRVAGGNLGRAARYLIALIDRLITILTLLLGYTVYCRVNMIYESTNFTDGGERWGFMVKNIVVKESFTDEKKGKELWNSNVPKWNVNDLLGVRF